MKNQNDLIISIVAIVLALIIAGVCFGTRREPSAPAAPEPVNLAPAALPQGDVVWATGLPSGGGSGGGGVAGGGRGAPMGMGMGGGMTGGRGMGGPGVGGPGAPGGGKMGGPGAMGGPSTMGGK
jgi:hypothetical protein